MQQKSGIERVKDMVFTWALVGVWLALVSFVVQVAANEVLRTFKVDAYVTYYAAFSTVLALALLATTLGALAQGGKSQDQQSLVQGLVQGMVLQKMLSHDPAARN